MPVATVILEPNTLNYEVEELELTGAARLIFQRFNVTEEGVTSAPDALNRTGSILHVVVHKFIGDNTGKMHLMDHQVS